MTTYVFNSVEVKLTGRKAKKDVEKVERRTGKKTPTVQILHEITPSCSEDGSWKKWVEMTELFTVDGDEK